MNQQGLFVAALLDASSKAFAAGTVLRMSEAGPEAAGLVGRWGFNELVKDTQVRLQFLAEALACGRPEVLDLDVDWLMTTYAARELPAGLLVKMLGCLRDELVESLPSDAGKLVSAYLQRSLDRLDGPLEPRACLIEADAPHATLAQRFLLAVLEGSRSRAVSVITEALEDGVSVVELRKHVVTKVQREIGRMWQIGEVNVADEHLGSRVVEDVLAQLRARTAQTGSQPVGERSVLLASVSGNLHDIGLRLVADQFEMCGWRAIFLGANVPAADLVSAASDFTPHLVALSVGQATHLRSAAATIEALRSELPGQPILVGGEPLAKIEGLWKELGADGCATNASDAVAVGERLVGSS